MGVRASSWGLRPGSSLAGRQISPALGRQLIPVLHGGPQLVLRPASDHGACVKPTGSCAGMPQGARKAHTAGLPSPGLAGIVGQGRSRLGRHALDSQGGLCFSSRNQPKVLNATEI